MAVFLIAELLAPHQVLRTSAYRGGLCERIRYLVNHQSCEGNGHAARFALIVQLGEVGYHRHVCEELGLPPDVVALMGTAANMNYAAHVVDTHAELRVCAVVTAGVEGNAGCAGDGASWHEEDAMAYCDAHLYEGTINAMVFINQWPSRCCDSRQRYWRLRWRRGQMFGCRVTSSCTWIKTHFWRSFMMHSRLDGV